MSRLVSSLKLAVVLLLGAAMPAIGQDEEDPGRFDVRAANVELVNGVYFLDSWIELRLPSEASEALRSGVPLTIRLDVEITYRRRFWFDADAHSLEQRYQLDYHALTERYVVSNLNSGDRTSFSTLFSALNYLGRVEHLPLIDAALLEPGRDYLVRLRAVLDMERFPGPLRLLAFWRRNWAIASDWYEWRLREK
ncbi:MAG TPA: DUF4390 domain-containing protein [Gammaproteobacteria bacterium]